MEIRVLKYFLTLVQEGNITAAAQSLHITQPTLSRQLMDLEAELNTRLFIRSNKKIILTEEGQRFYKRAEEIVELVDQTTSEFIIDEQNFTGEIHIGAGETPSIKLIARVIKSLEADNIHIRPHIYSGNADDVSEKLDRGLLDFGLFLEPVILDKYEFITLPVTDTFGLLVNKANPLAQEKYITPEIFSSVPLITSRQAIINNQLCGWLKPPVNKLNIVATYNLLRNAAYLVEEGLGSALAINNLIDISAESKLCFIPFEPPLHVKVFLAWKKHQVHSKAAAIFLKKLYQIIEKAE